MNTTYPCWAVLFLKYLFHTFESFHLICLLSYCGSSCSHTSKMKPHSGPSDFKPQRIEGQKEDGRQGWRDVRVVNSGLGIKVKAVKLNVLDLQDKQPWGREFLLIADAEKKEGSRPVCPQRVAQKPRLPRWRLLFILERML